MPPGKHVGEQSPFGPARRTCARRIQPNGRRLQACLISTLLITLGCPWALAHDLSVTPGSMARIGTVDERFQSYNVEMVEVTGGRFWKPYGPDTSNARSSNARSDLFAYRPPIDLTNARLRRLAAALAPAYMRVSGTWANATYFADSDPAPSAPPDGFNGVLTRQQWRGVVDFSQAVGAPIVTSFANFKLFHSFVKENFPEMIVLGPGATGDAASVSDLLVASGPGGVDVFSYHHYGTLSERCSGASSPEAALSEEWLSRTDQALAFHRSLRDKFEAGKPIWLTETAEAACGGNRWAATFLDTFRYLDQLGRLAKAGVQVVMHNTLAASDYGLLDENTLAPRPNYWGALLWRQLMGNVVLDPGVPIHAGLHVYAHCQRETPGGVSLLVINSDRSAPHSLMFPATSERYTLDAANLQDVTVRLNGSVLGPSALDDLPHITGAPTPAGALSFAPATITFLAVPTAANNACR